MPKTQKAALTTAEVETRLAERFPAPEFAFFLQVPNRTGGASRTADAVAMSVWPSRGYYLIGFEIKVSRADWLRELRDPKKADVIGNQCAQWYVVVGHESIVQAGELPLDWGLIVPFGKTLRVVKEAPRREVPVPTHAFLASLLRRAARVQRSGARDAAEINLAVEKAQAIAKENFDRKLAIFQSDAERLKEIIDTFEKESGIKLLGRGLEGVREQASMIRAVSDGRWDVRRSVHDLERLERSAASFYKTIKAQVDGIREDVQDFLEDSAPPAPEPSERIIAAPTVEDF